MKPGPFPLTAAAHAPATSLTSPGRANSSARAGPTARGQPTGLHEPKVVLPAAAVAT